MARPRLSFIAYAGPFMIFMLGGWWSLAQLVGNKRQLQNATRGLDMVEEMDPLERMRRRYGLDDSGAQDSSAGGRHQRQAQPEIPSLEAELEDIKRKVDIHNFDYKPVPRAADEE